MPTKNSFLEQIIQAKRKTIEDNIAKDPHLQEIKGKASDALPPFNFLKALDNPLYLSLIAEIKYASPSKGVMKSLADPDILARAYQAHGASVVSVVTEEKFFSGSLGNLLKARQACTLPILRKDFIIHPYQVYEARAYNADAILLIATILSDEELKELCALAHELGMYVLLEIHNEGEAQKALNSGAYILGINNRDLTTFNVDITTTARLSPLISNGHLVVSESGIKGKMEAEQVASWGARAILVGEALITSSSMNTMIDTLSHIKLPELPCEQE